MPSLPRFRDRNRSVPAAGRDPAAARALDGALQIHKAGRLSQAIAAYRTLLLRWPQLADAHNLLGLALHQSGKHGDALASIDAALERDPARADFHNNRGIVLLALERLAEAETAFRRALEIRPADAQALVNLGNALKARGDIAAAMDADRRAIQIAPDHAGAWYNLGNSQRESNDRAGAKASYRKALAIDPALVAAQTNLGALLIAEGDGAGARQAFEAALAIDGGRPGSIYGLAKACELLGDDEAAENLYRRLIAAVPDQADALNNLAGLLERRGAEDEAAACYAKALAIAPQHDRAALNLANLHARRGNTDLAARYFLQTKALHGNDAERLVRLGRGFQSINRTDDAIECFRGAVDLDPDDLDSHHALGWLLLERRETEAALEHLSYVRDRGRDTAALHLDLGMAQLRLCRLSDALAHFRGAIERAPEDLAIRSTYLMALNYDDALSPAALLAEHRAMMAPFNALAVPAPAGDRAAEPAGRRLRVGYVSPDFRRHSCANFILPLLAGHDRDTVELFCYSNVKHPDALTERFESAAEHWRDIRGLADAEAESLVRRDGIDVLVDLAGHTADSRIGLFLRRPAPLQLGWLGYPNTTGLAALAARLVDAVTDPAPAADDLSVERLIRIAGGFLVYRPQESLPDVAPGPVLRGEAPRFGCFNNANKLSPSTVALWAELLHAVPEARLVLRTEQFRHEIVRREFLARFAAAGIDGSRIEFPDWQNELANALAGHAGIDVALDPTPYGGTTTTCEALWMGVPVVTLAGDRHAARVGASILSHAGLDELIAATKQDYLRIAAGLARNRDRLAALRAGLRPHMTASPVADGRRLAAAFEAAFAASLAPASPGAG